MSEITNFQSPGIRGFLHRPEVPTGPGMVLTHGAGGDCSAPLLVIVANAFSAAGVTVLRCDLPFRQRRASGPPSPATAAADRDGLRLAVEAIRGIVPGRVILSGHSYGGRQASMLLAEDAAVADGLLLFSYPLHPPGRPERLRTEHFPRVRTPTVFVHGSADPFGGLDEMRLAIGSVPAPVRLFPVEGAHHDLKRGRFDVAAVVEGMLQ
jgi:predicted alpha/beta-hydrolase family hydrolase